METRIDKMFEVKKKILETLKFRGPSLPVHVAKQVNLSMLFASAFLSELFSEKSIKISNMKVGGSPLYYILGQEALLERFSNYLSGKEKEAFILLQEKKLLQEDILDPAIRVAIRNLKDFAFPLVLNLPEKQLTFWRFHSFPEEEAKKKIEQVVEERAKEKIVKEVQEIKPKIKEEIIKKEPEIKVEENHREKKKIEEKPLLELKSVKPEKPKIEKPDSEFVVKTREYLKKNNIEILEELDKKKKDYIAKIRVGSDLGKIEFLCIAKDKKKITEDDLALALESSRNHKKPAYFVSSGELNNKAKEYLEGWGNMIKFSQIR